MLGPFRAPGFLPCRQMKGRWRKFFGWKRNSLLRIASQLENLSASAAQLSEMRSTCDKTVMILSARTAPDIDGRNTRRWLRACLGGITC